MNELVRKKRDKRKREQDEKRNYRSGTLVLIFPPGDIVPVVGVCSGSVLIGQIFLERCLSVRGVIIMCQKVGVIFSNLPGSSQILVRVTMEHFDEKIGSQT